MHMMCIPIYWSSTHAPCIPEWFNGLNKTAEMEELISIEKDSHSKYMNTWVCWLHFQTTDHYLQLKR